MREHRNRSRRVSEGAAAIAIPSGAEALARHFYIDLLGLRETRRSVGKRGGLRAECVSFTRWPTRAGREFRAGEAARDRGSVRLLVRDLPGLVDALLDLGRRVDEECESPSSCASFWDPFGNHVTLLQASRSSH